MDATPAVVEPSDVTPTTPTSEEEKKKNQKKGGGYVLFPIRHTKLWDLFKTIEGGFWTAEDSTFLAFSTERVLDSPATLFVAGLVAAIRGARIPEKLSSTLRDSEAACFLGFQAMQENIHLEAVTYLASIDPLNESLDIAEPDVEWPVSNSSYGPASSKLLRSLESAATYAAASAVLCQIHLEHSEDAVFADITSRIEHDYDLSYKFALATCPAFGDATRAHVEAVLEIGRAVAELITFECNRAFPAYAVDICSYFVHDLENEIMTYVPPAALGRAAEGKLNTDSSF